jgi:hypothetical protein
MSTAFICYRIGTNSSICKPVINFLIPQNVSNSVKSLANASFLKFGLRSSESLAQSHLYVNYYITSIFTLLVSFVCVVHKTFFST